MRLWKWRRKPLYSCSRSFVVVRSRTVYVGQTVSYHPFVFALVRLEPPILLRRCRDRANIRGTKGNGFWGRTLPAARSKNKRQRVTPIVGLAREMLEQRLCGVEKGPLFLLEKGVVVTSAHVGHYLLTRRTRLPIATFTSHDLRRTFATMLAEMGISLDLVAAIVGHESGGKDTRRSSVITCTPTCTSGRRMRSRPGMSG